MSPKPGHTQAIALWHAHDELCPYCNNPIDSFAILEVDHIIPEKMLNTRLELNALLAQLGMPDLDLNSYRNWLPVHGRPCNRRKGDQQLPIPTLLNYLNLAAKFEGKAIKEEQKLKKQALSNKAFGPILHLIEVGDLSKDEAISFIESAVPNATRPRKSEPLVLSFSVNINALQEPGRLPQDAPEAPMLYDWLIGQLQQALRTTGGLFSAIEDDRNGETVSIRYSSWMLDLDRLSLPLPFGWELLEVMPYSEVYPGSDSEDLFARGVAAKHKELTIDESSSDPFPYKRCPKCTSPKLEKSSVQVDQHDVPFIFCTVCGWSTV